MAISQSILCGSLCPGHARLAPMQDMVPWLSSCCCSFLPLCHFGSFTLYPLTYSLSPLALSAILLLPNALCYFLIITQVTCKWKVKGLPRRRRGRPHPVSGSGCGQDTNYRRIEGAPAKEEEEAETEEVEVGKRHPWSLFFYFSAMAFIFCSCNDAGKFAGNNFNCVNCAVSCAFSFPLSSLFSL